MADAAGQTPRTFKTASFARSARRSKIADADLCQAIRQVVAGQADDLGGGVFKKRLNRNLDRGILIGIYGTHWVFEYLFAKKDKANIAADELAAFRKLSTGYGRLTRAQWDRLVADRSLLEICHDEEGAVQE